MGNLLIKKQEISEDMLSAIDTFMQDSNFLWSDMSTLKYLLHVLNASGSHQILVYDGDAIIGCNFFVYAPARINKKTTTIAWSNSTFLSPSYRKYVGLDLFFSVYNSKNVMGFGVTDINFKLLSLASANFIATSHGFRLRNDLYDDTQPSSSLTYPPDLFIKGKHFKKVNKASEIRAPKDGSWNRDMVVDFIRDTNFINKRFFKTPWKYMIYRMNMNDAPVDDLYFACRIRKNRGVQTLFLVDYRFKNDKVQGMNDVIEALYQLSVINNIKECMIFSTLSTQLYTKRGKLEKFGEEVHIISNIKNINPESVMITPADSDCDLIPLNLCNKISQ